MKKKITPTQKPAKTGRPTGYTVAIAETICQRVAEGENLNTISRDEAMPAQSTIYKWMEQNPELSQFYLNRKPVL